MSNYKFAGLLGLLLGAALGLGTVYMAWTQHQLQQEQAKEHRAAPLEDCKAGHRNGDPPCKDKLEVTEKGAP